jgi:predicted enzyme related to lactoylglutathione lyase
VAGQEGAAAAAADEEVDVVAGVSNVWVPVSDMDRAVTFYRDVLGLSVKMQSPEWSELDAEGLSIGLNGRENAGGSAGGGAVITFQPEAGIEAEKGRLEGAGAQFTGDVSSYAWGSVAPFKDSEGNDLQLYAPPSR